MAEIIELNCETTLDVPVERVLRGAADADLESVVIIGADKKGDLYFASSSADKAHIVWFLEWSKHHLFTDFDIETHPPNAA